MEIKKYKFIPRTNSEVIQIPGFLGGEFGREIDKEVRIKYGRFNVIKDIEYNEEKRLVKGSNVFYVVAVNEVLRDNGLKIRTATQADLEVMLRKWGDCLKGFYVETSFTLRKSSHVNKYLGGNLLDQISSEYPEAKMPLIIPLRGLSLARDSKSEHGLSFKLTEESELVYAPILDKKDYLFSNKDVDKRTGLPKRLGKGDRALYSGTDFFMNPLGGLCSFRLDERLNLDPWQSDLNFSLPNGRVVISNINR